MTAPAAGPNDFLDLTHPIYDAHVDRWTENERRLRGGDYILDELRRFRWETLPGMTLNDGSQTVVGEHYCARQRSAIYINFPEMFTLAMKGHLFRNRPLPGSALNFGTLGEVRRDKDMSAPTDAELLYYNADGIGNDGSQWDNFWLSAWERSAATGHRWMFVEAPITPARTAQDVLDGMRPYLVEWAPQQVTNWSMTAGQLDWAIVRVPQRRPKVNAAGVLEGNDATEGYLLLVRQGVADLGVEYAQGGWWLFDADRKLTDSTGTWERTRGEIPMWPLYYERDQGVAGSVKANRPGGIPDWRRLLISNARATMLNMSRAAITELGQLAIAFMNQLSAAHFDAWDAAASVRFLMGVDKDSYNVAAEMWDQGSQTVAVPPVPNINGGQPLVPTLVDGSQGAVTADVFDKMLTMALKLAEKIAVQEVSSTPESSGLSKRMGFGELKAPRLANIASELEQAQNTAIHFLEQRWTGKAEATGSTTWKREFDLADVVDDIEQFFEIETLAKLTSPTLDARLMMRAAKERGFTTDNADEQKIEAEFAASAARKEQASSLDASFGGGGGGGNVAPPTVTPPTPKKVSITNPDGSKTVADITGG